MTICSPPNLGISLAERRQNIFTGRIESSGAKIKRNTPVSPNLRAHVERFIQSLKQECLDKFVIVAERHLNHVNWEWRLHYNRERPHEARWHLPPAMEKQPEGNETVRLNDVIYSSRLGGLLKHYERRAACPTRSAKSPGPAYSE